MERKGRKFPAIRLLVGFGLLAVSIGIILVSRLITSAQATGDPRRITFAVMVFPLAIAIALCGWATLLSLLSLKVRGRLVIIGGVSALASGLGTIAVSILIPPAYQNAVALPFAIALGVGSLLLIGTLISYLGPLIQDTAIRFGVMSLVLTRLVFRNDLPPGITDFASDHELAMRQVEELSAELKIPGLADAVQQELRRTNPSYSGKIRNVLRSPDGPWWQRALAVAVKGFIGTAASLLLMRFYVMLFEAPILVGTQRPAALDVVVAVVLAIVFLPFVFTAVAALGAPIVLLIRDWRPGSPLRFWVMRGVVVILYAVGVALEVCGALLLLFGWRPM